MEASLLMINNRYNKLEYFFTERKSQYYIAKMTFQNDTKNDLYC